MVCFIANGCSQDFCTFTELNELIEKLDTLASDSAKTQRNFIPERKARILSDVESSQRPPFDSPDWALQPQYRKGMFELLMLRP